MLRAAIITGLLLLAAPAAAQFSFLGLKNSLVQFLLDTISTEGEFVIAAEGVEEPEDGASDLVGVTIADAAGVWLRIDRIRLSWNARRILVGEIEIRELSAEGVRVERAPQPAAVSVAEEESAEEEPEESGGFSWPRSPITTRIDDLKLTDVVIAPGVFAEQSLSFDAEGSLQDEGDEQSLNLTVTRTDDVSGDIFIDYLRDFEAETLRANLEATEAAGGIVSELASLPADSGSRVTVRADGPLSAWSMSLSVGTDDLFEANGRAEIDVVGAIDIDTALTLTPGPLIDPEIAALLSPRAALVVKLAENEGGLIEIEELTLTSPEINLATTGTFDRETTDSELDLLLEVGPGIAGPLPDVTIAGAGFTGTARGPFDAQVFDGALTLDDLRTTAADVGSATLDIDVTRTGEVIDGRVAGSVTGLRLDKLTPDLVGDTDLTVVARYEPERVDLSELLLESPLLRIAAFGDVDLAGNAATLSYDVGTDALATVAGAYDVDAGGAISLIGGLSGSLDAPTLEGSVAANDLSFDGTDYGKVAISHKTSFGETLSGDIVLTADDSPFGLVSGEGDYALAGDQLSLSGFRIAGLAALIEGDADVDLAQTLVDGTLTVDVGDLSQIGDVIKMDLGGAVKGDVSLVVDDGQQNAVGALTLSEVTFDEGRLTTADARLMGTDLLGVPVFDVSIDAAGLTDPRAQLETLTARASGSDPAGPDRDITVTLSAVRIGAEAAVAETVDLDAHIRPIDGIETADFTAKIVGIDASGATVETVLATGTARDPTGAIVAEVSLEAERLRSGDAGARRFKADAKLGPRDDGSERLDIDAAVTGIAAGPVEASSLTLEGAIDTPREAPVISLTAAVRAITGEDIDVPEVTARVNGPLERLDVSVQTAGTVQKEEVRFDTAARVNVDAGPQVTVGKLEAAFGEAVAALKRPTVVTVTPTATEIRDLSLSVPGAELSAEADLYSEGPMRAALDLVLQDIPTLAALAGTEMRSGSGTVTARIDTRPGRASGTADVEIGDLRFADVLGNEPLGLTTDADWNGRTAETAVTVTGPFGDPILAQMSAPLRATGGPAPSVPANGPLSGSVKWAGQIADLWALIPLPDHVLTGLLDIDLAIAGSLETPDISGRLDISDGQYQNLATGTILTELTAETALDGTSDIAVDLSARDGGMQTIDGRVALTDGVLDAVLSTDGAVLVRREDAKAAITLDITAKGPVAAPAVVGTVHIDRAEIRLVNANPPGVADLGPVRIKGVEPEPEPEATDGGPTLDIAITGDDDIYVRGRGLDSEWQIDLSIEGSAGKPRLLGTIEKRRGTLDLIGRRFELERGAVTFDNPREIDPRLDVYLERENDGIKGGIQVTGTASEPDIAFVSQPVVDEGEVLPRLLFGQSQQSLSGLQALELAAGVATLLDGTGGPLDTIRGAAGVDVLTLDTEGEDVSVTVGKNVAEGVFVGVKQPVRGGGSSSVVVEVEVFDNLSVDSEIGQDQGTSLGVNWKKDF